MLELSQITNTLWIGSRPEEDSDYTYIAALGVQFVVDLTSGIGYDEVDNEEEWIQRGVKYINIPIVDMCPPDDANIEALKKAVFPMISSGFITYIHCRLGKGRAPTIAIFYLITEEGYSFDNAMTLVKNSHDFSFLNYEQYDFLRRLKND